MCFSNRFWYLAFLVALAGCAAKEVAPAPRAAAANEPASTVPEARISSLEISYVRGNNLHRFVAEANPEFVQVELYRDRQLLKESKVDRDKYLALYKGTKDLFNTLQLHPAAKTEMPCRTPFTLKIKADTETRAIDGCRSTGEGAALGKIIKDAEFLVFSQEK